MSQSKVKDKSNSNDMARSIVDDTVNQAINTSSNHTKTNPNRNGSHSKPPLPHNKTSKHDSKTNKNNLKSKNQSKSSSSKIDDQSLKPQSLKKQGSSSNRHIVFHPEHPELINELSSTSTAASETNNISLPNQNPSKSKIIANTSIIPTKSNSNPSNHKNNKDLSNNKNTKSSTSTNNNTKKPQQNPSKPNNNNKKVSNNNASNTNNNSNNQQQKLKNSLSPSIDSKANASNNPTNLDKIERVKRDERRKMLADPNCFPKRFEVQVQARVRAGKSLSSQHLTDLPEGSVVQVEEIVDTRARISRPLCGWLSRTSKFGARIILPTNSKYAKIGGKIMFKRPILIQPNNDNNPPSQATYQSNGKVIDYDEEKNLYKVRFDDGTSQWIDIDDQNVIFVSQHKKNAKPLDAASQPFSLQTSQAFFNQFFCKDYPQYQAQSSSTTRHMDISPVASHRKHQYPGQPGQHLGPQSTHPHQQNSGSAHYPPPHHDPRYVTAGRPGYNQQQGHPGQQHQGHPSHQGYPPNARGPPGPNPNGPPHPQQSSHRGPPHPNDPRYQQGTGGSGGPQGPYGRGPPNQSHPSSNGGPPRGYPQRGHHSSSPPNQPHPGYPPNGQPLPHNLSPQRPRSNDPRYQGPPSTHPHHPNDPRSRYPPHDPRSHRGPQQQMPPNPNDPKSKHRQPHPHHQLSHPQHPSDDQFVNKVKEIERRIIQHLHQRGYTETHPDYHRYLQKAKELAIQKAGKERDRMLKVAEMQRNQAVSNVQGGPNQPNTPNPTGGPLPGKPTLSRSEYLKYLEYKKHKEQQQLAAKEQGKLKPNQIPNPQQNKVNAANTSNDPLSNKTSSGLTSKNATTSNQSSVKGLIVLRGLPGSGKTTLAKKLAQRSKNACICTEDRYHWSGKEDGVGEYKFQPQLVFLAREWCTKEIRECIQNNVNLIILDNHNARISMYEDHITYAVDHGYRFRIIEFVASASLIDKYRNRSYKKFPREVYVKLLKLWEHDPRTELINPTFGPSTNIQQSPTTPQKPQEQNINIPIITPQKQIQVNGKDNQNQAQKQQTITPPHVMEINNDNKQYQSQDYSRRPLEQGLNINLLTTNNIHKNDAKPNNNNKPE